MRKRRTVAWLVALAVGLTLVPAMDAAAATRSAAREQAQNHRITRLIKQTATIAQKVANLTGNVGKQVQALADLQTQVNGIDTRLKSIEAAAPVLVDNLTKLGAAAQQLKDGLTTVGAGLTTVGAGLTKLGAAYQAVEYGVTRVRTGPGGAGPALPITLTSSDIPDDGNTATAAGEIPISVGPNPGQVPADTLLTAHSAIRSAESDGAATGDPAGYVGGLLIMKCGGGTNAGGACDADPTAGTTLVPAGAVLCIVGPPASQMISVPGVGPTAFNLVTIQQKADRTDQTKPDASSVNPGAGATNPPAAFGPLTDDASDGCRTGDAGNTLLLNVQTQFVDIPTSTTPGPTD